MSFDSAYFEVCFTHEWRHCDVRKEKAASNSCNVIFKRLRRGKRARWNKYFFAKMSVISWSLQKKKKTFSIFWGSKRGNVQK